MGGFAGLLIYAVEGLLQSFVSCFFLSIPMVRFLLPCAEIIDVGARTLYDYFC